MASSSQHFPTLKLTYFDVAARAEATRVLFRLGGVPFEDERVTHQVFGQQLKPTLPYGQLPVIEIDGELVAETQAILRYAARISGAYPFDDPLAAVLVEEIVTTVNEIYETKVVASIRESDADKKRRMREAMTATILPTVLRQLEARLQQLQQYKYFAEAPTSKLFLHDVALSTLIATLKSGRLDHVPTTIVDGYPLINAAHDKVNAAVAAGHAISSAAPASPTPTVRPKKLKLTYFDIRARAEFIRLAFHIGGVAFEDELVTFVEMPARKPTLPYGLLPVLEIDGVVVAQSFALLRYAGMVAGLYCVDAPLAAARMDEIISRVEEVYHKFQASLETKDMEERRRLREQLLEAQAIQKIFMTLEKRIVQWKKQSTFIFGETPSVADLAVYHIVDFIKSGDFDFVPVTLADEFTVLVGIHAAVLNHPRVQDWYASRKP